MATQEWRNSNEEKMRKYRRDWYERNKLHAREKVIERKILMREWLEELKRNLKCEKCGQKHIACLHFHHRDPTKKEMEISKVVANGWSKKRIENEIKKCKVLCANCHSILHWEERQ